VPPSSARSPMKSTEYGVHSLSVQIGQRDLPLSDQNQGNRSSDMVYQNLQMTFPPLWLSGSSNMRSAERS